MTKIKRNISICGESKCSTTKALVDTGADRTLVPPKIAKYLDLKYTGNIVYLRSASGHIIKTEEATAHIRIPRTGCVAKIPVVVPKDPDLMDVILGNDFMKKTSMVLGYTKPRIISCPCQTQAGRQ